MDTCYMMYGLLEFDIRTQRTVKAPWQLQN